MRCIKEGNFTLFRKSYFGSRLMTTVLLWCLGSVAAGQAVTTDADFLSRVQADTRWLADYGSRQVGTASHARLQADLVAKVREIPGVEVWTDEFPVVVPTDEQTRLEVTEGEQVGQHLLFPIWPDAARLNTTPSQGIAGRLIYVGDASFERLPARGLRGQIAVMEMSAFADYRRAFDFGAEAVIFLESAQPGLSLPSQQSLYKPRYYVSAGPLADALRAGRAQAGRIVSSGRWRTVTARNIYVGVKPPGANGTAPYAVVAPYDSMSRVLGLAPGADAALDCAILLNVLRDQARRPSRPLLFGFVDSYHINQLGMRRMSAMLTITNGEATRKSYAKFERAELQEYAAANAELARFSTPEQGLLKLHDQSSSVHLRRLFKDALGRDLLRLRELQGELRLAAEIRDGDHPPAVREQVLSTLDKMSAWLLANHREELSQSELDGVRAAEVFARTELQQRSIGQGSTPWSGLAQATRHARTLLEIGSKPLRTRNRVMEAAFDADQPLTAEELPVAVRSWEQMAERVRGQAAEQEQRLAFFEPLDRQRGSIAGYFGLNSDGVDRRVCPFVVGIDISDCGLLVGPGQRCSFNRTDPTDKEFSKAIKRAVRRGDIWPSKSPVRLSVNVGAIAGRVGGIDTGDRALITSAATSFLLPGVTWITDDAPRHRVDTPMDRFDQLDWGRIAPQLPATRMFLDWVFTTKDYIPKPDNGADVSAKWRHGMGRIVDVSAGETVPRVPRREFLASFTNYGSDKDGIRRMEFAWTGHDGSFRIPLMCADVFKLQKQLSLCAFKIGPTGAIIEALTTSQSMLSTRLTTDFSLDTNPGEQLPRAVTFQCTELNGPSFFDPCFLEPLAQGGLIDAMRGGSPKRANFSIDSTGQMWGLVEPGMHWQLMVRAGASGVRMALMNAIPNARELDMTLGEAFQRGYSIDEKLPSIPTELSARDFFELNEWRIGNFRSAGISSAKINAIRDTSKQALLDASTATAADDGADLQRASVRALASEVRAYRAITEMGQDIGRGAIFLMLILVPFSVAMERLVFACARIGGQICAATGIFAAMTMLLWSFHPAFRISAQPLVIVMAFVILAMSVGVISIVLSRFRASMREFQSALAEGSGARMGRGGLLGSAVLLGIANMRKRKVRTAFTGITLVLVTFALLCFSSASSYIDKREFRLDGVQAERASVLVRRPSFGRLSWRAVDDIATVLGGSKAQVQARAWLVPGLGDANWRIWAFNPATGEQAGLQGVLGLPRDEHLLSGIDAVLPNWSKFADGGGCYLPQGVAARLAVKPGDRLVVRGRDLILCGIYDPIQLEDRVKLLDGQRILPYDYSKQEQDWVNRNSQSAIEQESESPTSLQPAASSSELYLSAAEVILMPTDLVRDIGGELRSIGIPCSSAEEAATVANTLMGIIAYPAYYANALGGVNVVVATPLIAVPPRSIAVPLIIAALIIFTTMLNSVSERKKEIYVYASLGLAPVHIGALFVAEALTYGLMGAVFGYIAGQCTASALTHMGWMRGVTLNYSGTAVINTMLLVQFVVVLAALVPAIIAGRIASPSSETDWKVPEPVDGVITSTLPFTVSPEAAPGLVAFISEYLEAHRDGVLGRFDVDEIKLIRGNGGCLAGLEARIWLAPFDVGVRQLMRLTIEPPVDDVSDIVVRVCHESGSQKLWWRLNKPFFFELRRQFLGWRKVVPERMEQYVARLDESSGVPVEVGH